MTNNKKNIEMEEASRAYDILAKVAASATWELPLGKYVKKNIGEINDNGGLPLYFEGKSASTSGIALPRGLNYYDIFDRVTLPTVLNFIKPKEQRRLLNLLKIFSKVWGCWEKDNLEFKVKGVTPSDIIKDGKSISFTDNLNGLTSYFAPTIKYIDGIAKKVIDRYGQKAPPLEHLLEDGRTEDKKIFVPTNSVVDNWEVYHTDSSRHGWSSAFNPLVILSARRYKMHVENKNDFEEGISAFKERFKTTYIPCAYSPIILDVHSIVSKGYKKFLKNKNDDAKRKRLLELDSLAGEEY